MEYDVLKAGYVFEKITKKLIGHLIAALLHSNLNQKLFLMIWIKLKNQKFWSCFTY